jgi:Mor family transcriptional regulator
MNRRLNDAAGRLLLAAAVMLHRLVAGGPARERHQRRRNAALRAAYRRGVTVPELAARLRLSEGWVRQVLNGKKPPEVEEAA